MTLFRSSVEDWRPLITQYGTGKPTEFLLRWLDKESAGNPCDNTALQEISIWQLDPSNQAVIGATADELHPSPPCITGARSVAYFGSLTPNQQVTQVTKGLDYVDWCISKARDYLQQYGYSWPEDSTSFWSMVKMVHVAPARIPVMLTQGIASNAGTPPADWDSLMATGPFPNTPASWTNNAGDVGSYASGFKLFGSIPTWFAIALGVGGLFAAVFMARTIKKRYPRVWTKLHLPEKVPVLWN